MVFRSCNFCDRCDGPCDEPENAYGEFLCTSCLDNAAEAAWDRHCEDFHDGGSTSFKTLQQQQIEALKIKRG